MPSTSPKSPLANNSSIGAGKTLPNSELKQLVTELYDQGTAADIVMCLTKLNASAQDGSYAECWEQNERTEMAVYLAKTIEFILRAEKFVIH